MIIADYVNAMESKDYQALSRCFADTSDVNIFDGS